MTQLIGAGVMQVRDLLKTKGNAVVSTNPQTRLADATRLMSRHRIGALVVVDQNGELCGIVSERDVARSLPTHGPKLLEMCVDQIMTRKTITCMPDDDLKSLMERMTEGRFRHLPVVQDNALCGVISIGDLVKHRLEELVSENHHLQAYITGMDVPARHSESIYAS